MLRVDTSKILTRRELAAVLSDLKQRGRRLRGNLILLRLAYYCRLRASEIDGLQIGDVRCEITRPHRRSASKAGRSRIVPLCWDAGTLDDLARWKADRLADGAAPDDPLLTSTWSERAPVHSPATLRRRFKMACKRSVWRALRR